MIVKKEMNGRRGLKGPRSADMYRAKLERSDAVIGKPAHVQTCMDPPGRRMAMRSSMR